MDTLERLMRRTRSVRAYLPRRVDRRTVDRIIALAGQAPSGLNRQPWLYAVVSDPVLRQRVRREAEAVEREFYRKLGRRRRKFMALDITIVKPFLTEAPVLVCLFADTTAPYWRESSWISAGWFMLAAAGLGLSTITYTPDDMGFLNRLLGVPARYRPEAILPLGYARPVGRKARKTPKEIIRRYE